MENGGKRKRVALSLKSFKKPALNYVKKQPAGRCLGEGLFSKSKSNSDLEKINSASIKEEIETPVSENRMKLLNLMPRFPNWSRMAPFPLNPLIKSLTETQNEVNDKTNEIYSNSNSRNTSDVEDNNYIDLPKLGNHFFSHREKARVITSSENYEFCTKPDAVKPSRVEIKQLAENTFGCDRREPRYQKSRECKQELPNANLDAYSKEDEVDQGYEILKQILGDKSSLTDKCLAHPSQGNSDVVEIDLTDDIQEWSDFGFGDFEFDCPSLSCNTNIEIETKDNGLPNLCNGKSTGPSRIVNMVDVRSASNRDKTSNGHYGTVNCNTQLRKGELDRKSQNMIGYAKDRRSFTSVLNNNVESTVCHESKDDIQITPPKREKQAGNSRYIDHKDELGQAKRSMDNSVYARESISKVDSFYGSTKQQAAITSKSKPACGNKDIPKSNFSHNSLRKEPQTPACVSSSNPIFTRKEESICNSLQKDSQIPISTKNYVYSKNDRSKVNSLSEGIDEVQDFAGKNFSICENVGSPTSNMLNRSQDVSRGNSLHSIDEKKQRGKSLYHPLQSTLHTATKTNSSQEIKVNPKFNSFNTINSRQIHVQAEKRKDMSFYKSRDVSKIGNLGNAKRVDEHGPAVWKSSQAINNPKPNSFYSTNRLNQAPVSTNKSVQKTNSCHTSSDKLRISDGSCSTSRDVNDGCLESDEDLFGSDDGLDEILATSFIDDLDQNTVHGTQQGDTKGLVRIGRDDDGDVEEVLGNLDNDIDDDTLVACCDNALSPTIPVRENASTSRFSGSARSEISSKGVKRKLDIPDAQSKVRRAENSDDSLKECPFCAKRFHSGFSTRDVDQHIAMCCSSDDIGNDDGFW